MRGSEIEIDHVLIECCIIDSLKHQWKLKYEINKIVRKMCIF